MNASIEGFWGLRLLVLGEAMLDCYLYGAAGRLSREAPVPVIEVTSRSDSPGGAANTARNGAALGAQVTLLSVVGDDAEGATLQQLLRRDGVAVEHLLVEPRRRTLAKHRVGAAGQLLLRFDAGSVHPLPPETESSLINALAELWERHDAVLISDYDYGVITERVLGVLAELQRPAPRVLIVDSKRLAVFQRIEPTAIKASYDQAVTLLGAARETAGQTRTDWAAAHGAELLERSGAQVAAVTLDAEGALTFERGCPPYRTFASRLTRPSPIGAGDTFAAAFTLALAAGMATTAAAEVASTAASVVVEKEGTAVCTLLELGSRLAGAEKYVADPALLAARLAPQRHQGQRVVFTNGCFDLLHRGHVMFLSQAKLLGDVLVVALNTDESVRRLKGPGRPITGFEDRVQLLSSLSCVDYVVAQREDRPFRLLQILCPDVVAKGGDYTREMLPEAGLVEQLGGQVAILPYVEHHSTAAIIQRIQSGLLRASPP